DRERAIELYAGPFLDGFFLSDAPEFERWVDQEKERFRRAWRTALTALAVQKGAAGEAIGARDAWQRLLADDPSDARATVGLMEVLETMGDRAGAIRQARLHDILLATEFGVDPDPAVQVVLERIRATSAADRPAPAIDQPTVDGPTEDSSATPAGALPKRTVTATESPPGGWWSWPRATGLAAVVLVIAALGWVSAHKLAGEPVEISSVAVLPLANLTGDAEDAYFVAGMHDALIAELAQIKALTVYSRQSVLRYQGSDKSLPEVARELGVQAVVEGAVFRSGDSVRITVQLVRARPEQHLISRTFTGPLNRALALQGEVARAVADAMRARMTPAVRTRLTSGPTVDPAAQDAYLEGLYHLERASYGQILPYTERLSQFRLAIAKLEEAVARDSTWARAYAKLALADHWLASSDPRESDEYFRKSRASALRALALDSTESQAWASLGFVQLIYDWDWTGAERSIQRAMELDPNSHHWIYALYLKSAGRYDEAIAEYRKAEARDPLSDLLKAQIVRAYSCADRHEEAVAEARRLRARVAAAGGAGVSGDSVWFLSVATEEYSLSGRHAEAVQAAEQMVKLTDTLGSGNALAFALAMGGREAEARALVARLESLGIEPWPAIFAALGDTARAVELTTSRVRKQGRALVGARCWLIYQVMPEDPRLQELLKPVGFPNN
ncbi:MAG: BTAD domain-containing putative transcriptional regulator, partial [Gemmatimonadales bacterium]